MRKTLKIMIALFILSISLPVLANSETTTPVKATNELSGIWVATVVNIDYPLKPTTVSEVLKNEAIKILDNAQNAGFNAVFLQVRPSADSFYPSKYYPWSKYLTGKQGTAPNDAFDPLSFWVTEAHKRGIQLHAWFNPYRVTKRTSNEPYYDISSLDPTNPARVHPDWTVKYSDGNLYFNPGIPEVRQLIIDSALEVIQNYEVDGIHFDDYFYPGKGFDDQATYIKYGTAYSNIGDWRRSNVNTLIGDLSNAIKSTGKNIRFGISPFGIWANKDSNSLGSDTRGGQSYYDHYADTRKWVKDGMIDYIAPQLYWNIGYSIADYSKLISWWKDTVSGTNVDLYIGQAAYRAGNSNPSSAWYGVSEIEKQLKLNATIPEVKGSIYFSYKSLVNNPALFTMIKTINEQKSGAVPTIPVTVVRSSEKTKTRYTQYYLNGTSDPSKPLFLNGKPVEGRSKQGYFGILVSLAKGSNTFTFSQQGSYATRVIYRETTSSTSYIMKTPEIPSSSVFPKTQEYRSSGEKITLSCQAPVGAKVTVKLSGKNYSLKPSTTVTTGAGISFTKFSYVYTVPKYTGTPRNINLGAPTYTMKYKGRVKTRTAPAKIGVIMKNSPFYAKVTRSVIDTYKSPSSGNGANYELYNGMIDSITGMTSDYIRLSSGQWVKKGYVTTFSTKTNRLAKINVASYAVGEKWDSFKFNTSVPTASIASFDGVTLKINISCISSTKLPILPENSLFSAIKVTKKDNSAIYALTLKADQRIEGYYIENLSSGLVLNIKRHVSAKEGDFPLAGITVMVDPGHGGSESGATGPLGSNYPEKTINLKTALKLQAELERLGATVLMTRTTDKTMSLVERLAASRNAKPDMFISIHANSMPDNFNISKISGFSSYYREAFAQPLSKAVLNRTIEALARKNRGLHNQNFYVMRGTWAPSILTESGFVPNPNEFEWLIDENEQLNLAKAISEGILNYFMY